MLERFLDKTSFSSQEDFMKNFKVKVPDCFNFGYDVVDEWARIAPEKKALLWTNDQGKRIDFTFADIKRESDKTASYFQSLGIGHGDMVMLILKRRYEFWFSQTGSRMYSRHSPADRERHSVPMQCRRHKNDCILRRRDCSRAHQPGPTVLAFITTLCLHRAHHSRRVGRLP